MDLAAIQMRLDAHERRLAALEAREQKKASSKPAGSPKSGATNLPEHILGLRDQNFFRQPKVASEVHAKLQDRYACEINRVEMALYRLVKRHELRAATKKVGTKQLKAYAW